MLTAIQSMLPAE